MRIYIPTRGRIERQTTWDELPDNIKQNTVLVCPAEEAEAHTNAGRNVLVSPVEGIVRKRQWLLEYAMATMATADDEKIAMVDDDLIFLKRKDPSAWNLARCTPTDVEELFDWTESLLDEYAQVGVSPRQGNNRFFPETLVTCSRVTNFHGYDLAALQEAGIRFQEPGFPDHFTMEDFHVTLRLLEAGYLNAVITDYAWDQHGSNAKGGCALYRNGDSQHMSANMLAAAHPGLVRVVTKATKGGWAGVASGEETGGGTRTDVVISWKKAFELGAKRAA